MSPSRVVSVLLALFSIFWFVSVSQAQITSVSDPTSTPTPGVGHDYIKLLNETVNPATGSLSVRISVPVPQGRKLTIPFAFTYDSSGAWFLESVGAGGQPPAMSSVSNSNIGPLTWGGWSATFPQLSRVLVQRVPNQQTTDGTTTCDALTGYVFTDPAGARHSLGLSHWYNSFWQACQHGNTFSEYASGGDDFYRAALVGASNNVSNADGTPEIADPHGTVYNFGSFFACMDGAAGNPGALPPLASGLPISIEDRNGNIAKITTDSNHDGCSGFMATDTAGRAALSVSHYGYAVNSNTTSTVSVAGLSPYTVTWAKVSPTGLSISHSSFGSNSCWAPPAAAAAWTPLAPSNSGTYVVTAITLPNGQQYQFGYDPVTGFIKKITYPSGGYVAYTWGINPDSSGIQYNDKNGNTNADCVYLYDTPAISQRSVSFDGSTVALTQTFSYSTNWGTIPSPPAPWLWVGKQATVTTTDNIRGTTSKTIYNYVPNTIGLGVPNLTNPNGVNSSYLINAVAVENTISYYGYSPSYPLLRTETKNWVDQFELSCDLTTLNDGSGQIAGVFYGYSLYGGQVTEKDEYDFGQLSSTSSCGGGGSLPTPARKTVTTYQNFAPTPIFPSVYPSGAPIFDRPSSVIVYDANGNRVAETDYKYDQASVANVSNMPTGTHDEANYASTSTASRGNATTVTKQCFQGSTACAAGNSTTTFTYDETGQVLTMVDACGNTTCNDMTGTNHTTTYSYADNFDSPPSSSTNAYVTQITSPPTNGVSHIQKFKYAYSDGQPIQSTDQNNQVTSYLYADTLRRPTETDYPDGGKTTLTYNDAAPSPSVTTSRLINTSSQHVTSTVTMDGMGHIVKSLLTTDPDCASGDRTDTTHDGLGRVYTVSNPYCSTGDSTYGLTTYTYDPLSRTTQVTNPDNSTVLTTYTGRATQVQDEGNGTRRTARISQVDGLGRLASVCEVTNASQLGSGGTPANCGQDISATGFLTTCGYDTLGNLTSVSQSGLNGRTFQYDSLSRLSRASNPESGTTNYGYDANANLTTKTDARGITTTYAYDALNRLTGKTYSDGTPAATSNYDQSSALGVTLTNTIGRKSSQSTAGSNATGSVFSYDPMGRVVDNSQCTPQNCGTGIFAFQYTQYDFLGDLISATNAIGVTFTDSYNTAARLIGISTNFVDGSHPGTLFSNAHYNPFGALTGTTVGNGVTESWSYNNRLWQRSRTATFGATTPYSFSVTSFAPNGDILTANDSANGNWTYSYDDFNRLLGSNQNSGQSVYSYDYDRFGNRWHQNGSQSSQLGFDANNHITGVTGVGYDAAGNLTSDGSHTYFYDAENRLIQVNGTLGNCSTATACYVYDAEGHRVRKTTASGTLDFLYDNDGNKVAEVDSTGVFQRGELYADGRHFAVYAPDPGPSGATFFIHADWLGTERARTNMTGTACETITSLPFGDGQIISDSCGDSASDVSPMHFTGKERDSESGLDNFGARYNSSSMGRFMSPDPIFISPARLFDPQGLNLYAYVRNNPLNITDPTGLDFYLACQTENHSGCGQVENGSEKIWVQGQTVDGKFQAYDIDMNRDGSGLYSDQFGNDYKGTFDQNGVSFTSVDKGGASGSGRFINGSDETDVNGSGIFGGLQGKFVSDCGGSCQARGSLYELEPGSGALARAEAALQLQGKSWSWLDRLSGAHAEGRQWMDKDGRIHVIENINGINNGKTELHYEGHPNTGVTERSLHFVNAIRDLASGRADEQKNLKLP